MSRITIRMGPRPGASQTDAAAGLAVATAAANQSGFRDSPVAGLSVGTILARNVTAIAKPHAGTATATGLANNAATATPVDATVTVDQLSLTETSAYIPLVYGVQSTFAQGISSGQAAAAANLMAQATSMDLMLWHWSGGYANSVSGAQLWSQNDFAPDATTRIYTDSSGSRRGMDRTVNTNLQYLRDAGTTAGNTNLANAQMVFAMFDHPQSMIGGDTRASGSFISPWPAASLWDGAAGHGYDLADEIITRYGASKVAAFSYGQEFKGVVDWTSSSELQSFINGFHTFAALMRANHPTVELWFPHVAMWGYSEPARAADIDQLIAGGSTFTVSGSTLNDTQVNYLLANVNPAYVDRWTMDNSIVGYGGAGTAWRYTWSNIETRLALEYHVARVTKLKMQNYWGQTKPIVAIESYPDTDLALVDDWLNLNQQATAMTGMSMWKVKAGLSYDARWDPQGTGLLLNWWSNTGTVFPAWTQMAALANTFPPGTDLYSVSTDNIHITAVASADDVMLLNTSEGALTVRVSATGGDLSPVVVPGYNDVTVPVGSNYAVLALPAPPSAIASDTYTRTAANLGTADQGGAYTAGSGTFGTDGSRGFIETTSAQTRRWWLASVSTIELDYLLTLRFATYATSGQTHAMILTGRQSGLDSTMARAVLTQSGSAARLTLALDKLISTAQSSVAAAITLNSGHGHDEGNALINTDYKVRLQCTGTNPTTVRARAWLASGSEPSHWCVTGTITNAESAAINAAGAIGLRAYNSGTVATLRTYFDNLTALNVAA